MKAFKKLSAALLTLCLCVSCFSFVAHAADGRIAGGSTGDAVRWHGERGEQRERGERSDHPAADGRDCLRAGHPEQLGHADLDLPL